MCLGHDLLLYTSVRTSFPPPPQSNPGGGAHGGCSLGSHASVKGKFNEKIKKDLLISPFGTGFINEFGAVVLEPTDFGAEPDAFLSEKKYFNFLPPPTVS